MPSTGGGRRQLLLLGRKLVLAGNGGGCRTARGENGLVTIVKAARTGVPKIWSLQGRLTRLVSRRRTVFLCDHRRRPRDGGGTLSLTFRTKRRRSRASSRTTETASGKKTGPRSKKKHGKTMFTKSHRLRMMMTRTTLIFEVLTTLRTGPRTAAKFYLFGRKLAGQLKRRRGERGLWLRYACGLREPVYFQPGAAGNGESAARVSITFHFLFGLQGVRGSMA